MSLIQWNLRGLNANREQIKILFREHEVMAICLQETKLGNTIPNMGSNYEFIGSPPLMGGRAHGGTGIVISKQANYKILNLNTSIQACAVQIYTHRWITLCSIYLEPSLETRLVNDNGQPRQLMLNDLQSLIDQLPQPFMLLGDFNAKHTLWGETFCDRWGLIVEDLIDRNDIILMNDGSPTRHDVFHNTDSAIDLSICSSSLRLDYQWSVDEDTHGSDHWPIHLKYLKNVPSPCLLKWKVSKADWTS